MPVQTARYLTIAILLIIFLQIIQIMQLSWHFVHTREYIRQQSMANAVFLQKAEGLEKMHRALDKAMQANQVSIDRVNELLGIKTDEDK